MEVLQLDAELARYEGEYTPCRRALQAVKRMLEGSDRQNISQVVIFLSDGKCTPVTQGEDRVLDFAEGLRSAQGENPRLQFYFLRFEGQEYTPGLEQLAENTGGSAIEVRQGDPTRILYTFAQALARSQGYEPLILSPSVRQLPAYRGANRVRLLAIARGDQGEPLAVRVRRRQGGGVDTVPIEQGTHRFPGQQGYRFASVQYRPVEQPVEVEVVGAGEDWEVVALPEYHLAVNLALRRGGCEEEGETLGGVTPAGSGLCAVIELVNEEGRVVGKEVTTGQLQASLRQTVPGGSEPRLISATEASSDLASFRLDIQGLESGHHEFQGQVQLGTQVDDPRVLTGTARTLQAVDLAIRPVPSELRLDPIQPGEVSRQSLEIHGNFAPSEAVVSLEEGENLPSCVTLSFDGKELGETISIRPKQGYWVEFRAAKACGETQGRQVDARLRLELAGLDSIAIPVTFRLENNAQRRDPTTVELRAGTTREVDVAIPAAWNSFDVQATAAENAQGETYELLRAEILSEPPIPSEDGEASGRQRVEGLTAEQGLSLQLVASGCCRSGTYALDVYLWPKVGATTIVPLVVEVEASWWTCYGSWVLAGTIGLLAGLLVFYVLSMFSHTTLLDRDQLSARLVPLRWPRHRGAPQPASNRSSDREEVEDIVHSEVSSLQRVRSWLRANPLVFGSPGREYRETAELFLTTDLGLTSISLVLERDVVDRLRTSEEIDTWEEGRLFARAGNPVSFFVVRGPSKKVQQMTPEGWFGKVDDLTVEQVSKGQRFIRQLSIKERKEGAVAGWVLE